MPRSNGEMRWLPPDFLPPWRSIHYDGRSVRLAEQARTFFEVAIQPACAVVAAKLDACPKGPDAGAYHNWTSLRETELELHRSFALALGGQWERHFRQSLWHASAILAPGAKGPLRDAQSGDWATLNKLFARLRGFPLSTFPAYPRLATLYLVTSAVRHGNGRSCGLAYAAEPELFSYEPVSDWSTYFALGGEPAHSIHKLDIGIDRLAGFACAVEDFWLCLAQLHSTGTD